MVYGEWEGGATTFLYNNHMVYGEWEGGATTNN